MHACRKLCPATGQIRHDRRACFGRGADAGPGRGRRETGSGVSASARTARTPRSARQIGRRVGDGWIKRTAWTLLRRWAYVRGRSGIHTLRRCIAKGIAATHGSRVFSLSRPRAVRLLGRRVCLRGTRCVGRKAYAPGASIACPLHAQPPNHNHIQRRRRRVLRQDISVRLGARWDEPDL